jgi:hypothetical protein
MDCKFAAAGSGEPSMPIELAAKGKKNPHSIDIVFHSLQRCTCSKAK